MTDHSTQRLTPIAWDETSIASFRKEAYARFPFPYDASDSTKATSFQLLFYWKTNPTNDKYVWTPHEDVASFDGGVRSLYSAEFSGLGISEEETKRAVENAIPNESIGIMIIPSNDNENKDTSPIAAITFLDVKESHLLGITNVVISDKCNNIAAKEQILEYLVRASINLFRTLNLKQGDDLHAYVAVHESAETDALKTIGFVEWEKYGHIYDAQHALFLDGLRKLEGMCILTYSEYPGKFLETCSNAPSRLTLTNTPQETPRSQRNKI
jgi:hypothetical protein